MPRVALYENAQDAIPRVQDLAWPELVAMLTTHRRSRCAAVPCPGRCAAKNGPAWSPVDIVERRRNENVRAITVGVFDLDHLTGDQVDKLELDLRGYSWILHSTHSSKPGDVCLRLVLPFSRPVQPQEWAAVRSAIVDGLALPADPATRDLARLYYLPDAPEGTEPLQGNSEGELIDVDAFLERSRAGLGVRAPPAPIVVPEANAAATEALPTDLHALADLLRRHCRAENRGMIGRVLRGEAFADRGGRDNALQSLMSTIGFVLPLELPEEVILHMLRPSFMATPWEDSWGDGLGHLNRVALDKLRRARERKVARDVQREKERGRPLRERLGLNLPASKAPVDEGEEDPDAWVERLITFESKEGTRIKVCEANVVSVLQHSPEWRGVLRFNEVAKDVEVINPPTGPLLGIDALEVEIAVWFQHSDYGKMGLTPKPPMVRDCIKSVAYKNSHDPLRDELRSIVWDGTPRADGFLRTYFGAEGDEKYLRAVGGKWLISAVARALRPGCKVDTVLILEGIQGLGKSSAFRALGGQWFSDASVDIGNKDSAALASRFWILELAELQSVRRSDAEALKAFLSRNEDTYRPPYARVNQMFPRRCVFVGTTNAEGYLKHDPSGFRRFWPVKCTKVALSDLKKDAAQLWAEAVVRFERGEQWWLTDEDAKLAEAQAEVRSEDVGGPDIALLEWVLRQTPDRRIGLTADQLASEALGIQLAHVTRGIRMDIGHAMKRLGFARRQTSMAAVRVYVYDAPPNIAEAPVTPPGAKPSPVVIERNVPGN